MSVYKLGKEEQEIEKTIIGKIERNDFDIISINNAKELNLHENMESFIPQNKEYLGKTPSNSKCLQDFQNHCAVSYSYSKEKKEHETETEKMNNLLVGRNKNKDSKLLKLMTQETQEKDSFYDKLKSSKKMENREEKSESLKSRSLVSTSSSMSIISFEDYCSSKEINNNKMEKNHEKKKISKNLNKINSMAFPPQEIKYNIKVINPNSTIHNYQYTDSNCHPMNFTQSFIQQKYSNNNNHQQIFNESQYSHLNNYGLPLNNQQNNNYYNYNNFANQRNSFLPYNQLNNNNYYQTSPYLMNNYSNQNNPTQSLNFQLNNISLKPMNPFNCQLNNYNNGNQIPMQNCHNFHSLERGQFYNQQQQHQQIQQLNSNFLLNSNFQPNFFVQNNTVQQQIIPQNNNFQTHGQMNFSNQSHINQNSNIMKKNQDTKKIENMIKEMYKMNVDSNNISDIEENEIKNDKNDLKNNKKSNLNTQRKKKDSQIISKFSDSNVKEDEERGQELIITKRKKINIQEKFEYKTNLKITKEIFVCYYDLVELLKSRDYNESIKEIINEMKSEVNTLVLPKIKNNILELMDHKFANYIIYEIIKFLSKKNLKGVFSDVRHIYIFYFLR